MPDHDRPSSTPATIERIARAIRRELGEEAEAYPGCRSPEGSDPLNRAFRAVVRELLAGDEPAGPDLSAVVSRALRLLAERRLAAEGWEPGRARLLIELEPGSPDDWLAFLILSSPAQLEHLLDRDPADPT